MSTFFSLSWRACATCYQWKHTERGFVLLHDLALSAGRSQPRGRLHPGDAVLQAAMALALLTRKGSRYGAFLNKGAIISHFLFVNRDTPDSNALEIERYHEMRLIANAVLIWTWRGEHWEFQPLLARLSQLERSNKHSSKGPSAYWQIPPAPPSVSAPARADPSLADQKFARISDRCCF